jgi:hypothetical protein
MTMGVVRIEKRLLFGRGSVQERQGCHHEQRMLLSTEQVQNNQRELMSIFETNFSEKEVWRTV